MRLTLCWLAGGPAYFWELPSGQDATTFEITVPGSSGSATEPWQLSHVCAQDISVAPVDGSAGFMQPAFTSGQIGSCV